MEKTGIKYLILPAIVMILGIILSNTGGYIIALLGILAFGFTLFFFRDPARDIPPGEENILSPADGKIVQIKRINSPDIGAGIVVAIFMSPLNVHINRAPCDGKVLNVKHFPGGFKRAYLPESSFQNERTELIIENNNGKIKLKQIAGIIARRIVCRVGVGDTVKMGEKFGLIHFGSRVELILPKNSVQILAKCGQKVTAGIDIIAKWKN